MDAGLGECVEPTCTASTAGGVMPLPRTLVEEELERVIASKSFDASDRNRRFLRYVVEETLAGHADRLKGYTVALEVFDRDTDFDPQLDPVVRIEAGRLRRSLERYYLTEGSGSPITIQVPKGKYIPLFDLREPKTPITLSNGAAVENTGHDLCILVFPIVSLPATQSGDAFCSALTDELILRLNGYYRNIVYLGKVSGEDVAPNGQAYDQPIAGQFLMRGALRVWGGTLRIVLHLSERESGRLVESQSFEASMDEMDMVSGPMRIAAKILEGFRSVIPLTVFRG